MADLYDDGPTLQSRIASGHVNAEVSSGHSNNKENAARISIIADSLSNLVKMKNIASSHANDYLGNIEPQHANC